MVGFNHETAIKRNHPIVSVITALDLPKRQAFLLVIHESIYKGASNIHYHWNLN
jgi:hypothetical protein